MDGNSIFSNAAQVKIQGDRVLRLISIDRERAKYQVTGFSDPIITVFDYRLAGLRAIAQVLDTGEADGFAPQFNVPAHVTILNEGPARVLLELRETDDPSPAYMLWIAIGIEDTIPVYDYVFDYVEALDAKQFAFLSVYRRPRLC
jgi:hypothetical protein